MIGSVDVKESIMPPVHPVIVHFPIALITLSVVADLCELLTDTISLRAAGFWALIGAAVGGALAVVAGLFDMNREQIEHKAHERVHFHMKIGFTLFAAVAGLTIWRWLIYLGAQNAPGWGYLSAALLVLGLTLFQGYLGGKLVFAHGVGVAPTGQGTEPPGEARKGGGKSGAHSG